MGWKEVTPVFKAPNIGKVRFSIRLNKTGMPNATVIVPAPVMADLGWTSGKPVKLLVGEGPDVGRFRLQPAEKAPLRFMTFGRGGARVALGNFAGLPAKAIAPENIDHYCTGALGARFLEIEVQALIGAGYKSIMR